MRPKTPPNADTNTLMANRKPSKSPSFIIDQGLKPNLPKDFMNKMLPNTPAIVLPTTPNEYFFKIKPVLLAAIIPIRILINEINVPVIIVSLY